VEVIMQILNTLLVRHQQNQLQENCSFTQPWGLRDCMVFITWRSGTSMSANCVLRHMNTLLATLTPSFKRSS
jgi:hypothetical protein